MSEEKKADSSKMSLDDLIFAVVYAFLEYEPLYLQDIDPTKYYSDNYKGELIREVKKDIWKLKADYPDGVYVRKSQCTYCYPGTPAYSFYSIRGNEFCIRYVIRRKDDENFIVSQCNNRQAPDLFGELFNNDSDDDLPF